MAPIFGKIRNGQIQIQRFYREDVLKNEGKPVSIEIEGESKTLQQLRYVWGVIFKLVSEYTGFSPDEVSETYKKKFLSYPKERDGKMYFFTRGLSTLKKEEMAEFIDKVIQHATSDLGLIIPDPDIEYEE